MKLNKLVLQYSLYVLFSCQNKKRAAEENCPYYNTAFTPVWELPEDGSFHFN
jgi:hypothetical protein